MLELVISVIGLTILLGFFGNVLFQRTSIPNTLWLLVFGMGLGALGFVGADFIASAAGLMGAIAIIGILSDGGLHLDLKHVVKEGFLGSLLMFTGLLGTTGGIVILLGVWNIPLPIALFIAIALAGTSASVVIPIVQSLSFVSDKLKTILSIEAISDTFSIVVALFMIDFLLSPGTPLSGADGVVRGVVLEFLSAISIGIIFGLVWGPFIGKLKRYDYSYAATLGALILLYAFAELFGSSGAIAVFTAGIMLANAHLIYHALFPEFTFGRLDEDVSKTHSLFAFLIRVFFFVFLGMVVGIPEIDYLIIGAATTAIIVGTRFIYINLFIRLKLLHFHGNEKMLTYFMIPRGLSAAVLAVFALASGVAYGEAIVQIIFSVIIFTILLTTLATFSLRDRGTKTNPEMLQPMKPLAAGTAPTFD
ncbi:MAG: cation:proton antiporter [Candidatus Diapherotrites archaeon]|nr:cation:proton antiporter [Candidatus Diapherotrites archaeon]MDZ4256824.1 cation:proton antiporter [archaeon]